MAKYKDVMLGYIWSLTSYLIFIAIIFLLVLLHLILPAFVETIAKLIQLIIIAIHKVSLSVQFFLQPLSIFNHIFNSTFTTIAQMVAVLAFLIILGQLLTNVTSAKLRWILAFGLGLWFLALPAITIIKLIGKFVSLNVDEIDF